MQDCSTRKYTRMSRERCWLSTAVALLFDNLKFTNAFFWLMTVIGFGSTVAVARERAHLAHPPRLQ